MAEKTVIDRPIVINKDQIELKPSPRSGPAVMIARPFGPNNSNSMGGQVGELDNANFNFDMTYEEMIFVVEGEVVCTYDGKEYEAKAGGILYLPKGIVINFRSKGKAKIFAAVYPAV